MEEKKKTKTSKIISIITDVILYAYLTFAVIALVFVFTNKAANNGTVNFFGNRSYIVLSGSMEKGEYTPEMNYEHDDIGFIKTKSLVKVQSVPEDIDEAYEWYSNPATGDVVNFTHTSVPGSTITHRIIEISHNESEKSYRFVMQGDNWSTESGPDKQTINYKYGYDDAQAIVGKVVKVNYGLGVFISSLTSPVGKVFIIIVPSVAMVGYEAYKLISTLSKDKRKTREDKEKQKDAEIEELKRRLKTLEEGGNNNEH